MGRDGALDETWPSNIHAFLTKPVRQTELYDQIKQVMSVAVEQTVSPDPRLDATEPEPTEDSEPTAGATVLLAEDNPVNQEVMREYLMALGCHVEVVETGLQAVAAFERTTYDLIFMDCQMPDMDGLDATMMLRLRERQQNRQPRTPIIAVTADAFEAQRERCLEAGMDDYIRKPFDQKDLSAILQRWLNHGGPLAATKCESDVGARAPSKEPSDYEHLTQCEELDSSALSNIASLNRGGSSENVDEIIKIYLDITPKYLADLRSAINASDVLSTERTAHKLKSSSATLGAMKLAAQCRDLEHLAHEKTLDYALLHLSQIESSFEKIRGIFSASIESQVQHRKSI